MANITKLGTGELEEAYFGITPIEKIFVGAQLFWPVGISGFVFASSGASGGIRSVRHLAASVGGIATGEILSEDILRASVTSNAAVMSGLRVHIKMASVVGASSLTTIIDGGSFSSAFGRAFDGGNPAPRKAFTNSFGSAFDV